MVVAGQLGETWGPNTPWYLNISGNSPAMAASKDVFDRINIWTSLERHNDVGQ